MKSLKGSSLALTSVPEWEQERGTRHTWKPHLPSVYLPKSLVVFQVLLWRSAVVTVRTPIYSISLHNGVRTWVVILQKTSSSWDIFAVIRHHRSQCSQKHRSPYWTEVEHTHFTKLGIRNDSWSLVGLGKKPLWTDPLLLFCPTAVTAWEGQSGREGLTVKDAQKFSS